MLRQVIFAALLLVAGCGGSNADVACDEVAFNDTVTVRVCTEALNVDSSRIEAQEQFCKNAGGIVIDECPIGNRLGVCSFTDGGIAKESHIYATAGVTRAQGKAACESFGGTWIDE